MKEYIKKFADASTANNYAIADIPFVTSVATDPVQNLVCNKTGKHLENIDGVVCIKPEDVHIEWVDLGLSVKWADANLGATNADTVESWYGDYYAWGETETKEEYSWSTYKFGTSSPFSKYDTDGKTVLEAIDDVATATYGSNYRMPTKAELEELKALPNQWVTNYNGISGLNGRVFTGTNGNTLFIPAAGLFNGSAHKLVGSYCGLWSSSLHSDSPSGAWSLDFTSGNIYLNYRDRYRGFSVRCVSTI